MFLKASDVSLQRFTFFYTRLLQLLTAKKCVKQLLATKKKKKRALRYLLTNKAHATEVTVEKSNYARSNANDRCAPSGKTWKVGIANQKRREIVQYLHFGSFRTSVN